MRFRTLAAAVAIVGVALAAVPVNAESTKTHTRHVAVAKHPATRITVTRRSYLDPGTEVLPQAHASQSLYSLGFMQHNPNYDNPGSEFSVNVYPLSDPFFLRGH